MKRDLSERLRKFAWTGGFSTQITTRILRLVEVLRKIPGALPKGEGRRSKGFYFRLSPFAFGKGVVIDSQFVKPQRLRDLYQESGEIVAIMTTIGKRAKERKNRQIAQNKNS